jgi:hypothetical protein
VLVIAGAAEGARARRGSGGDPAGDGEDVWESEDEADPLDGDPPAPHAAGASE